MSTKIDSTSFWRGHISRLRASGLTRAEYCRQNGLIRHKMAYWQQRLTVSEESPFAKAIVVASVERSGARLRFPNGLVLETDAGSDPQWLAGFAAAVMR